MSSILDHHWELHFKDFVAPLHLLDFTALLLSSIMFINSILFDLDVEGSFADS